MATKKATDTLDEQSFLQQTIDVLNELKSYGWDRRKVEREIKYRELSLDQLVSRGSSEKLFVLLSLLLKSVKLERALKERPATGEESRSTERLERMEKKIDNINTVASDTFEHVLVNVSLSQISVYHSAHMEAKQFGGDYRKISAELFAMTDEVYNRLRGVPPGDQKNKVA